MGGMVTCEQKNYPELGNFWVCEFQIDGKTWYSTEQYFQAMKFLDEEYQEKIRGEMDGMECWYLGQTRDVRCRSDWEDIKVEVMRRANYEKFKQNKNLKDILVSTEGEIHSHSTDVWTLQNKIILQELRRYFKHEEKQVTT